MEIEAKYISADPDQIDRLTHAAALGAYQLYPDETQRVVDRYLDTADRRLWRGGYACRLRRRNDLDLVTVKGTGHADGAIHHREEYEFECSPDLTPYDWPNDPAREIVLYLSAEQPLAELLVVRQNRTLRIVQQGLRLVATLSIDEVEMEAGDAVIEGYAVEVELESAGTVEDLREIEKSLLEYDLQPESRSKFEIALTLLEEAPDEGGEPEESDPHAAPVLSETVPQGEAAPPSEAERSEGLPAEPPASAVAPVEDSGDAPPAPEAPPDAPASEPIPDPSPLDGGPMTTPVPPDYDRPASPVTVQQLCARFAVDMDHARHVAAMCLALFDSLPEVHGLPPSRRNLLEAAALLHNLGMTINPDKHHTVGRDLILFETLDGYTVQERDMLACTTRFHRKKVRPQEEPVFVALPEDLQRETLALAAILRVGDALDYSGTQTCRILSAGLGSDAVYVILDGLHTHAEADRALKKSDLWNEVFALPLRVRNAGSVETPLAHATEHHEEEDEEEETESGEIRPEAVSVTDLLSETERQEGEPDPEAMGLDEAETAGLAAEWEESDESDDEALGALEAAASDALGQAIASDGEALSHLVSPEVEGLEASEPGDWEETEELPADSASEVDEEMPEEELEPEETSLSDLADDETGDQVPLDEPALEETEEYERRESHEDGEPVGEAEETPPAYEDSNSHDEAESFDKLEAVPDTVELPQDAEPEDEPHAPGPDFSAEPPAGEEKVSVQETEDSEQAESAEEKAVKPGSVKKGPGVTGDDSIAEAGRKVLRFHFERLLANEAGTVEGEDIEALHDMRVATRRLRAAVRLFGPFLPEKEVRRLESGLKRTGRILGPVRDLDVMLDKTRADAERYEQLQPGDLDPLLRAWEKERDACRKEMIEYLYGEEYEAFKQCFERFLTHPIGSRSGKSKKQAFSGEVRVRYVAPSLIWEHYGQVRAYEPILPGAPVDTLHALRIDCKRFRYALEFLREPLGKPANKLIDRVTVAQDHLGELHDAEVAAHLLRQFLEGWWRRAVREGASSVGAQGITDYLFLREQELRDKIETFPEVWEGLTDEAFRSRLGEITANL